MRYYAVVFADCAAAAELKVKAARHTFRRLADARKFAKQYYNSYIFSCDNNDFHAVSR
jgi:hypothetical protein